MRTKLLVGFVVALVFTLWWNSHWQSAATTAEDRGRTGLFGSTTGDVRDAESTRRTGLWVGGVASALFLLGAFAASPTKARRKCPHCAEDIAVEARVCKHCGRDLPVA